MAEYMDGKGWIRQMMDGQTEGLTDGQMGGDKCMDGDG